MSKKILLIILTLVLTMTVAGIAAADDSSEFRVYGEYLTSGRNDLTIKVPILGNGNWSYSNYEDFLLGGKIATSRLVLGGEVALGSNFEQQINESNYYKFMGGFRLCDDRLLKFDLVGSYLHLKDTQNNKELCKLITYLIGFDLTLKLDDSLFLEGGLGYSLFNQAYLFENKVPEDYMKKVHVLTYNICLSYLITDYIGMNAGYRGLTTEYIDGSFELSRKLNGFVLGAFLKF